MKTAKAVLTFNQIGSLIEGKPVTIRLPRTEEPVPGQPEYAKVTPGIELELNREPLARDTRVVYTVTCRNRPDLNVDLDMSFMDKVFADFDRIMDSFSDSFHKIFRS
jgi:hypothetical protein